MQGQECLLIKTASEIALKSNFVRRFFTKKLVQSIKFALKRNNIAFKAIVRGGGRLYVFCENPKTSQKILSRISGIHAIAFALHFDGAEYPEIEGKTTAFAKKFLKKGETFALDINAASNPKFSSKDLENRLGAAIQKAIAGLKVKLKNPEKEIFIEVRKRDFFIYTEQVLGLGGLPLGVEGNVAMLFSGKSEELVAAFLLMHRGCNVFPVVKKKTPALKRHVESLVPLNDYRKFVLTEEKDLPALVEERKLQAIATADSKTDEKSLGNYKKFDEERNLVVLRPLLLYPKESEKRFEKLFH